MPSARCTRSLVCKDWWHTSVATTGPPEHPAFPHAMVLTAYIVLSPVTGLVCHRRQPRETHHRHEMQLMGIASLHPSYAQFRNRPRISLRSVRATIFTVVIARSEATKQSRPRVTHYRLPRGACHRARIRATRWLATVGSN